MPFAVGEEVIVATLHKRGRVVEASASGRYRIVVGSLSTWCEESDLERAAPARTKGRRGAPGADAGGLGLGGASLGGEVSERQRQALARIDLHGMTVDEALRAVEARVDQAIRAGLDRLEIIHGTSGGRLRAAVRRYLAGITSVRYAPDPKNAGVTWVFL